MKVLNKFFFTGLLLIVLNSCKESTLSTDKDDSEIRYRYYSLEKMGWKSKKNTQKIDAIQFTATEVPILYYLLKDNESKDLIAVDSLYELNKTNRVIEFEFQDENERDLLEEKFTGLDYQKSVAYMSFEINKDFIIVTSSKDTITCDGVIFERTFKSTPSNKLLLFFGGVKEEDKIQLVYSDKLFKKGILKFRFQEPILNL